MGIFYILLISNIFAIMDAEDTMAIIGFGSPIVDAILNYDEDPELSEQVKKTLKYHMEDDFPVDFYNSVLTSDKVRSFLGGSAMNTIRLVKHILKQEKVMFVGSIGQDPNGNFITSSLEKEGIIFQKEILPRERTSTVIVLVHDTERAFYSDLASSNKISVSHFVNIGQSINNSKIFYADAYLLGTRFDLFEQIYKTGYAGQATMSIGLASENIIRDNCDKLISLIPYLDMIFCNKIEIETLKTCMGKDDLDSIDFLKDIMLMDKKNKEKSRIIVMTQSTEDTIIATFDFKNDIEFIRVPVKALDKSMIVDTNGAGDAFSAGFLAGYMSGYDLRDSAKIGNYLASKVIQLKGFQIPECYIEEALYDKTEF
jgi:adenosine kinase